MASYKELYALAIDLKPFTEKDRVKRTEDTFSAIMKLKDYQEKIQLTLDKLTSGKVLSEADADVILDFNVPEVSSLMRPHASERQWKIRYDKANNLIRQWRRVEHQKTKEPRKLPHAEAFLWVFTEETGDWFTKHKPNEAWYRYFESVYRIDPEEEE